MRTNPGIELMMLLILNVGLLFISPSAGAETCTEVSYPADHLDPKIGTCWSTGGSCTSDSQCSTTGRHYTNFCVEGICSGDSSQTCYGNSDCIGVGTCTHEIVFELNCSSDGSIQSASCTCGQFADGSWWVEDPNNTSLSQGVTITAIRPDHFAGCESIGTGSCRNGWDVNPMNGHSYDNRDGYVGQGFSRATPSFPYRVDATNDPVSVAKVTSIRVKSNSTKCTKDSCIGNAGILTVVPSVPPSDAFRPPVFSSVKPGYWLASNLDTSKIPNLPANAVSVDHTMADSARRWGAWQVGERFTGDNGRSKHQLNSLPLGSSYDNRSYHASIGGQIGDTVLRFALDDTNWTDPVHGEALIGFVQFGLDYYWISQNAVGNAATSPPQKGRTIAVAFAGHLLGDSGVLQAANDDFNRWFGENHIVDYSSKAGRVLWQGELRCTEQDYWSVMSSGSGNKWCADPYGYIDQHWFDWNGQGSSYQYCCSTMPWKGQALAVDIYGLGLVWSEGEDLLQYMDRWMTHGYWHQGDQCAPPSAGTYGVDYGPAPGNAPDCHLTRSCDCIRGSGRGRLDGTKAGGGGYRRDFADDMWNTYRACAATGTCTGMVNSSPLLLSPTLLP